jgi:DNA-binding IclR family transcriptional regulator
VARSVTSKVCAILDAVCAAPAGLSATALGRRLGMPLSTAHRLATELVEWGGQERQADGRYRVGLRLWEIAATAPRATSLRDAAGPTWKTCTARLSRTFSSPSATATRHWCSSTIGRQVQPDLLLAAGLVEPPVR